ncbi:MAG: ATP-grasp domain-containing protein, partial [Gammaproteobacteria bacterium]|nr:ATP-grasp domain-containing protein [Gammaproteobacteria bacterium]
RQMGDKASAREAATRAGVPVVPGSGGRIEDPGDVQIVARDLGFPIMIKAVAGGGGRGIRIAQNEDELNHFVPQAAAEAKAAFGDGGLYLEKFITRARHIEVQVLGDGTSVIHCYERECSLQRRRQKLWEEAPATAIPEGTRHALCAAAVQLAQSVNYRGAGTVEFLYDDGSAEFYFIEMNTRIQVEHPVTELVTGIDLVQEMLRIAAGEPLRFDQEEISVRGHAIEVRINAEDPARDFMPSPGTIEKLTIPGGPGVRFDSAIFPNYEIPPFYDSLIGKLIVHDQSRAGALERLKRAIGELEICGIKTTKPLFAALAEEEDVRTGQIDTRWLERWLEHNPLKSAN